MFLCYSRLYSNQNLSISIWMYGAGFAIRLRHVPVLQTASYPWGTDALFREVFSAIQAEKRPESLQSWGRRRLRGSRKGPCGQVPALPEAGCWIGWKIPALSENNAPAVAARSVLQLRTWVFHCSFLAPFLGRPKHLIWQYNPCSRTLAVLCQVQTAKASWEVIHI